MHDASRLAHGVQPQLVVPIRAPSPAVALATPGVGRVVQAAASAVTAELPLLVGVAPRPGPRFFCRSDASVGGRPRRNDTLAMSAHVPRSVAMS